MSKQEYSVQDLLAEIDLVFPSVEKPEDNQLVVNCSDCVQCAWVVSHLRKFVGYELPREALRGLHSEMSCLTPVGWRWAIPSFLRYCLISAGLDNDDIQTEYMIYFLGGVASSQPAAAIGVATFDDTQIACLIRVLEWCLMQSFWSEDWGSDIAGAVHFLRRLRDTS
jgi:hypothetical protein